MQEKKIITFKQAVQNTPDVSDKYCAGLGAFGRYAIKIRVPNPSKIEGSLDIDSATKDIYPEENRWDYAMCYDGEVFYIEIHPATTTEIAKMIKKLEWIKRWLSLKAPKINKLTTKTKNPYHWVQSANFDIPKHTLQYKALIKYKIIPKSVWNYNTL